jgi:hypothetical protein
MHQEGAIVLGTGGDNSNSSVGSFFEGVMTAGYPTDAADNAVQANIASIGYGSSALTPTPTSGTTLTPTPTVGSTPTATPTGGTTGLACSVHYAITNQWPGGFGANIAITNTGTTAWSGWTLTFSFANGQTITQLWNGSVSQSGSNVMVTNASYNGTVVAGASVSPGFNGTWNGTNAAPTSFRVNGATCS